ncbi:drug/metabolite transporter (DMT) superfamily protein [Alkalihalophilus pseudofirmus OF4]|uniref:Drug/metabolite transporter (DMT) superfamily protein n=1 Tax=Alkalihalophilus pseudofirmus (strain ATCC BAA-2126 / JCM 17055 / OF4) TaxID=398511 RepID=D3FRB3_ALKPO|nr:MULTISPECIES: DMT family transporter [Alkalihalophilus]ADC51504.1 drug/metabolite transporter (DMT) superfamily protein [Alkalihalophilus pseudofirmus OF4]MED1603265.1 DMT family transporter [Alkalihalophilus marmarensis]
MSNKNVKAGAWAALIAGVVFGVNSNIVKVANNTGLTTLDLLIYQFGFAILYFFIRYLFVNKKHNDLPSRVLIMNPFNWIAGITTVLTGLFYYNSIQLTDPSIASLGLFQYPWILFLFGIVFAKEKVVHKHIIAILCLWLGTILLIGGTLENMTLAGMLYGIAAGVSFATYLFSLQKITNHSFTKVFIFLIAAIIVLFFCLGQYDQLNLFTFDALLFGVVTAILGQILVFELLSYAAKNVSSVLMATLTTTELPVAMLLTWFIWGPMPNFIRITGLSIMVTAILWLKFEQSKPTTVSLKKEVS